MQNVQFGLPKFIEVGHICRVNDHRAEMFQHIDTCFKNLDDARIRSDHISCHTDTRAFESIAIKKLCVIG